MKTIYLSLLACAIAMLFASCSGQLLPETKALVSLKEKNELSAQAAVGTSGFQASMAVMPMKDWVLGGSAFLIFRENANTNQFEPIQRSINIFAGPRINFLSNDHLNFILLGGFGNTFSDRRIITNLYTGNQTLRANRFFIMPEISFYEFSFIHVIFSMPLSYWDFYEFSDIRTPRVRGGINTGTLFTNSTNNLFTFEPTVSVVLAEFPFQVFFQSTLLTIHSPTTEISPSFRSMQYSFGLRLNLQPKGRKSLLENF